MLKIDCRNHLKNGCCILTGGECTHETCTIKEPELQTANKESQDERMAVLIAETIFCVYGESQEYKDVVAWIKEHVQVDILDEEERELPKPTQSLMNEAILAFPDDKANLGIFKDSPNGFREVVVASRAHKSTIFSAVAMVVSAVWTNNITVSPTRLCNSRLAFGRGVKVKGYLHERVEFAEVNHM